MDTKDRRKDGDPVIVLPYLLPRGMSLSEAAECMVSAGRRYRHSSRTVLLTATG